MSELPRTIDIDGVTWQVVVRSECHDGYCDPDKATLYIADRLSPELQNQTLWHELIHAIYRTRDVRGEQDEESVASMLGPAIYALLKANPDLWW